ncbi:MULTISPECIES: SRPBCC domain-containing protein [unclassified Staphylococcus]|uniref:SRPBCC family protein n=2 Tax=Staphylococcus TaxID=1279 RepID=UPI0021CEB44C|nr:MULTISPECIES: SRPBCC domain-containing protein [unclassified Staphylococcus]UXR71089.1 SRPBCC domain-containing protein [Staphylococcus sp. IVB6240]UXR73384.1 SRPBCC domain-containing protein [Staphylococcus sp. IVB6238]UXR75679.1 SRPBCC domain-containing protein [Staphylococcus sp. IVB6233]
MNNRSEMKPIEKNITLQADIDKVWQAVSTSEGIASWWMANDFEAKPGKPFTLHAGEFGDSPCKVKEVTPKNYLSFYWGKDWEVIFKLDEIDSEATEFTLIHSGWDETKQTEFGQPHPVVQPFMNDGWDEIVKVALPKYLEQL